MKKNSYENIEKKKKRAKKIFIKLNQNYENVPKLFLNYKTSSQLVVAIILSAQSTDAQVNKVTSKLFKKYKTVDDFANANITVFEKEIYSTGYYKQKAKNIINCFKKIKNEFGGKIPLNINDLTTLPGIGRKTANLILVSKNIVEGIAVDTHVFRLSHRLGFSNGKTQWETEKDLMNIFEKKNWDKINGLLIMHGRAICTAKKPDCKNCFLNKDKLCPLIGVKS